MCSVSYVTCVDIISSFFNLMVSIFILRCADPETLDDYYYFADRPTGNNFLDSPYTTKN